MSKYHSRKVIKDGETFDSLKEYRHWCGLKLMERAGAITDLRRQVKFVLIPAQREEDTTGPRGGVIKGRLLERECSYVADFVYEQDGNTIVEDVKSPATKTPEYKIKRKLMLWVHGIRIKET